jgi:hypothetical protein
MASGKLTKPASIAAAAAIAVGGGTYPASSLFLPSTAGAAQFQKATSRHSPVGKHADVRPSAAAIGLARDFGISRAAAQELIESTYR